MNSPLVGGPMVRARVPLLVTESRDEFEALEAALIEELAPRNVIEQMLVDDIVDVCLEERRFRKARNLMISVAIRAALEDPLVSSWKQLTPRMPSG